MTAFLHSINLLQAISSCNTTMTSAVWQPMIVSPPLPDSAVFAGEWKSTSRRPLAGFVMNCFGPPSDQSLSYWDFAQQDNHQTLLSKSAVRLPRSQPVALRGIAVRWSNCHWSTVERIPSNYSKTTNRLLRVSWTNDWRWANASMGKQMGKWNKRLRTGGNAHE